MLRPANPTDALALLPLQLRAAPNEARSGAALGKPPALLLPLGSLAAEWLPHRSAAACLGAVAARRPRSAWLGSGCGRAARAGRSTGCTWRGIVRRTPSTCWRRPRPRRAGSARTASSCGSPSTAAWTGEARAANFHVCSTDDLYYRPRGPSAVSANGHVPARPACAEDLHDLFRVYLRAFLGRARQAEGLTLSPVGR